MSARRIGILGGTFDPIHRGHIDIASAAESALGLQRVFVIPSRTPPHRAQPVASAYHRFAMIALSVAGRPGWRATDLELRVNAPSYTSGTLRCFQERGFTPSELFFVVGADAFAEIVSWKDYPVILDGAHFAVVSRPGWPVGELPARLPQLGNRMVRPPTDQLDSEEPSIILIDAATADVSSTAIRKRRACGESIAGLVDGRVQQHIEQHGLYGAPIPGRRISDRDAGPAAGGLHGES
jgi:nicotinate-nucleotide adenylyltransferase